MAYRFVPARNYTPVHSRQIDLIVLHDMEAPEKGTTAESVAAYFAGINAPRASAHYCIDNDSIVQCVRDHDVAWHAPGANHNGIGLEHAGYASQTEEQWLDPYGVKMLNLSARLAAQLCNKYRIPARYVGPLGLIRGERGITTHRAVSQAFHASTHTDPGAHFPITRYVTLVGSLVGRSTAIKVFTKSNLRKRTGKQAWIDWRMGWGDWKRLGPRNAKARPSVRRVIPVGWYRALAHQKKVKSV